MSSKERRKSDKSSTSIVTLTVPPEKLRAILKTSAGATKSATLSSKSTPTPSTPLPSTSIDNLDNVDSNDSNDADATAPPSPDSKDNKHLNVASAIDSMPSMPSTPSGNHGTIAMGAETPGGTPMAPPNGQAGDSPLKKKGVKRSAAAAGVDGTGSAGPGSANGDTPAPAVRVRSKPGPKKKAKLMVEIKGGAGGAHKLGPKASMGAINAGLRALDRSGKPCRKWVKRGFRLKTFTGVSWAIPRWKAPPKHALDASASADSSSIKEADSTTAAAAATAAGTPADTDMLNAPTPSAEPPTAAATPVAT